MREKGTMFQLKCVTNRTAVPSDPAQNMKAAEDFMLLLVHSHVVSAARVLLSHGISPSVTVLSKAIVSTFLQVPQSTTPNTTEDGVHMYALEVFTLGMLWHSFHDAIKEGDGERVLCYWKFLMVVFHEANRRNYAKEAVNLLLQQQFLFSDRKAAQLKWSRFVNSAGKKGGNIPCDLHMEHLNRRLKSILSNMGSNVNPSSIIRAGKSVGPIHNICSLFEKETAIALDSQKHPYPSFEMDLSRSTKVLDDEQVFVPLGKRNHASYNKKHMSLQRCNTSEFSKWIEKEVKNIMYS